MSNPMAYDKGISIPGTSTSNIDETVEALRIGMIPYDLVSNVQVNSNYRDAVIHKLIDEPSYSLNAFAIGVKSSQDSDRALITYSEFGAAIAYAMGDTNTAMQIVLRNPPTTNSSLIKSIAEGLASGMQPMQFKELLRNSTALAAQLM
jgi:hypothetical protein